MMHIDGNWQSLGTRESGVTLIELMIAVAIVAILASIAYPSYQEHVRRGNRAEARAVLLESSQFLERNYTIANRYDQDSAGAAVALPFIQSPKSGTARYTIAANFPDAQSFTLNATPVGSMVGDTCGTITLSDTGQKGAAGVTTGAIVDQCWGR